MIESLLRVDRESIHEMRLGPYKKVMSVPGSSALFCTHDGKAPGKLLVATQNKAGFIMGFIRGNATKREVYTKGVAHNVMQHCVIGISDMDDLPHTLEVVDRTWSVILVAALSKEYEARHVLGNHSPHEQGQYLADFFSLLPIETSASVLLGAADPERSYDLQKGDIASLLAGINTQARVIEAISLMEPQTRLELFSAMAKQDPGHKGRASRLLSLIGASWNSNQSAICAPALILKNFPNDIKRVGEMATQLQDDLPVLRAAINAIL